MSLYSTLFSGSSRPKLVTLLTSGSGTYIPTQDNARLFVRVQAGGASGSSSVAPNNVGGGAGALVEAWVLCPIAGMSYTVGAGGAAVTNANGNAGTKSSFGSIVAQPGNAGSGNIGGAGGYIMSGNTTTGAFGSVPGLSGGAGGSSNAGGGAVGFSKPGSGSDGTGTSTGTVNGGGGGDSGMGKGGAGAASASVGGTAGAGYGSGGGGSLAAYPSGAGAPGAIEIWDFGA